MTENGGDNSNPKDVPPAAVLAKAALKEAIKPAAPPAVVRPSFPTIDPNYTEPPTFEALRDEAAAACIACAEAKTYEEALAKANRLADATMAVMLRCTALFQAGMPFAKQASHMANMRMVLAGEGRNKEPSGGMWLNGVHGGQLQPNEQIFFAMCDAIGRKATEDALMEDFKKIQDATKLVRERDKHLEGSAVPTAREGDAIQHGAETH